MKALLIIDMPEDFDYTRCSIGGDGNIYYERDAEQKASIIGNIRNLKPMLQKQVRKLVTYRRNEKPVCPTCGLSFSDEDVEWDVSYCKFCGQRVELEMEDDEYVVVLKEEE